MTEQRVTSKQVDDLLLSGGITREVVEDICRDWKRYRHALTRIRDHHGGVCEDFLDCDHGACRASVSAWFEADRALQPDVYQSETEPVLTARSWLAECRDMRDRLALVAPLVAAVREEKWPRYNSTQYGRFCIDCGRQHDVAHRDNCFGVRIAAALAGLEGAETTQNGSGRDEGDAHE